MVLMVRDGHGSDALFHHQHLQVHTLPQIRLIITVDRLEIGVIRLEHVRPPLINAVDFFPRLCRRIADIGRAVSHDIAVFLV